MFLCGVKWEPLSQRRCSWKRYSLCNCIHVTWRKRGAAGKKKATRANSRGRLQYCCVLASLPVANLVYWNQCHSMGGILLWASWTEGYVLALDKLFFGSCVCMWWWWGVCVLEQLWWWYQICWKKNPTKKPNHKMVSCWLTWSSSKHVP